MLKLHGFSISPNHNKVKLALLEKGIEFEEVMQRPSQDETFLVHSPMGKIPTMEVDGKFFSESGAILEYLENAYPAAPLMPTVRITSLAPFSAAILRMSVISVAVGPLDRRGFFRCADFR